MMQQRDLKTSTEHLANLVALLAGVILIVVGVYALKNEISTIAISVGGSVLASSAVALWSAHYIQKYQKAKEISEAWGIVCIEEKRATMNPRIKKCEEKAKRQIDLIAFGLKSLRDGNSKTIEECLNRGIAIRIITVDPDSDKLKWKDAEEKKPEGSTAYSIRQLIEWADKLNSAESKGRIEIRFSDVIPAEFYNRVDNSIFVGPYQYGRESQQIITSEYRNPGTVFEYYTDYFESLWNDPEYCRTRQEKECQ